MSNWIEIGTVADIPVLGARVIPTAKGQIAVFRTADDTVFAVHNRCPHRQGPLSEGIVHGHRVTCPLHSWVIDLRTGQAEAPDTGCTPTLPVDVRDGVIHLDLSARITLGHPEGPLGGHPADHPAEAAHD